MYSYQMTNCVLVQNSNSIVDTLEGSFVNKNKPPNYVQVSKSFLLKIFSIFKWYNYRNFLFSLTTTYFTIKYESKIFTGN